MAGYERAEVDASQSLADYADNCMADACGSGPASHSHYAEIVLYRPRLIAFRTDYNATNGVCHPSTLISQMITAAAAAAATY